MQNTRQLGPRAITSSAAAYAVGFLATTLLHELAHFVVAGMWGRAPVMFHNAVRSQEDVALAALVSTKLAGPLFSLLQGVVAVFIERRTRALAPKLRLLLVWFAFHGLMNFTGYVFTTAFVPGGDMGAAARFLGVPMVGMLLVSALGFWAIRIGARAVYPGFVALLPNEARGEVGARNRGLIRLALVPWPLGVLMVLPASLPFPHWLSSLYVIIAGVGAVWFTDFSKAVPEGTPPIDGRALDETINRVAWLTWALLTMLAVFWLRHGVSWPL